MRTEGEKQSMSKSPTSSRRTSGLRGASPTMLKELRGASKSKKAVTEGDVLRQLKTVIDPELGINIVDLGLIYGVRVLCRPKSASPSFIVRVKMTLTSPGCPLAPLIHKMVEGALMKLPQVEDVKLEIVWDPPWSIERVSKETRLMFGW